MCNKNLENQNQSEKIDFLKWTLERNINFISNADTKTGYLISLNIAMLGALAAIYTFNGKTQYTAALLFTILCLILSALSIYCAAISVWPRTSGPNESLIFFASISNLKQDEYLRKIKELTPEELIVDISSQIHRNSEIAREKYKWIRKSIIYCFLSSIPWFVSTFYLLEIK